MFYRTGYDSKLAHDADSYTPRPSSSEPLYADDGILGKPDPATEVSILRRRLKLAREDTKRLKEALENANREAVERESQLEKRFQTLERKLKTLRQSLKDKELALDKSEEARLRREQELASLRQILRGRDEALDLAEGRRQCRGQGREALHRSARNEEPATDRPQEADGRENLRLQTGGRSCEDLDRGTGGSADAGPRLEEERQDDGHLFDDEENQLPRSGRESQAEVEPAASTEIDQQLPDTGPVVEVADQGGNDVEKVSSIGGRLRHLASKWSGRVDLSRFGQSTLTIRNLSLFAALLVALPLASVWSQRDTNLYFPAQDSPSETALAFANPDVASSLKPAARRAQVPMPQDGEQETASVAARARPAVPIRDRLQSGLIGPPMIRLEPGRFRMGSRPGLAAEDAFPVHEVSVGRFLIGAHEVTFTEYDLFARSTGRRLPNDFGWGRGNRPVVDVAWWDAQAYVEWLSRQTGRSYRLPSEAEWEYAARAGTTSPYWWGHDAHDARAVCFDCGSPWDNRSPAPIASFSPNPFGLYDTAGNVLEWVSDCYRPSYQTAPSDGRAWVDSGNCEQTVARGGAFNKPAYSMRNSSRHHFSPGTRIDMLGFRIARDNG